METRFWAAGTQRSRASPMVRGVSVPRGLRTQVSSCHTRPLAGLRAMHSTDMSPLPGDALSSREMYPPFPVRAAQASEVRPAAAAAEPPERGRPLAGDLPGPEGSAEPRPKPPACSAAGPASQSGQRQGPESAASFRSHVSRRRRLKMMVASWHRGESWNPGRKRSGAEAAISSSRDPRLLAAPPHATPRPQPQPQPCRLPARARATHSSPPLGTPPGCPRGLPGGTWPHQLELEGAQEVNQGGEGTQSPTDSAHGPPSAALRTPAGRELCLDGLGLRETEGPRAT